MEAKGRLPERGGLVSGGMGMEEKKGGIIGTAAATKWSLPSVQMGIVCRKERRERRWLLAGEKG